MEQALTEQAQQKQKLQRKLPSWSLEQSLQYVELQSLVSLQEYQHRVY
jgi:hypothetical protein